MVKICSYINITTYPIPNLMTLICKQHPLILSSPPYITYECLMRSFGLIKSCSLLYTLWSLIPRAVCGRSHDVLVLHLHRVLILCRISDNLLRRFLRIHRQRPDRSVGCCRMLGSVIHLHFLLEVRRNRYPGCRIVLARF